LSNSPASTRLIGLTSMPTGDEADSIVDHSPMPVLIAGSRKTTARVVLGAQRRPFRGYAVVILGTTGDIAARSGQTGDETSANRIGYEHEHDRHCACR